MIITARGQTGTNGLPEGVDRELIVAFNEISENESYYLRENIQTYTGRPDEVIVAKDPFGAIALMTPDPTVAPDLNLMTTMNGFLYGNRDLIQGRCSDVASLLTMGMIIADMEPDNPGIWLFHCHVGGHLQAGMSSLYTVEGDVTIASR